ncbi:type VI secretion system Vgr family protein [Lacinutrix mariniflava]|uniref:type VI secretion system Vgr family protein n=1 Tax=Lacinutrix mariniflava TaxID=342955 RepID=UPI0006E2FCC7|nr:phage baseplate assembly protein V [Lacinutrix mariniflava]
MALQSKTTIFISGTEISAFKAINLHQRIDSHHKLELVCRMDVLEDLSLTLGESSKNFLGETLTLQITSIGTFNGYKTLEFKGIVSQITTVKGHEASYGDEIIITALSPTFIADDGPHYASYNDLTLSDILDRTFSDYDKSKLEVLIQPNNTSTLHYSVQNNESAYDYASRLAAQYGEWFYYNGTQLIFGTPETEELSLTYGFDLKEYNLNLIPQSHNYKYYANDYLLNDVHQKNSNDVSSGASGYSGFVSSKANTIFNKQTKVWHNLYNDSNSKQRLDNSIELQKKAIEIQQVKLNGVSDNPGVKLGKIVTVEGANYRVTNVTHTNTENGDYQNRFQAVTAEFDAYPNTNINAFPKSDTQTAIVMENADPDGFGRIRVQFPWQKDVGEMTPWIRVVSPHAGGDKGFHFIPEINEEVLVGFEGGNAEHPYMMGSLYNGNGKASAFQSNSNAIKALQTRSGNKVVMNDDDGSITIADPSGNVIVMQGNGEIIIQAPNKLTLASKDINIMAGNSINIIAKPNEEGGGVGTMSIYAQRDLGINVADEGIGIKANKDITITSETASANLNAKTDANIKGETSVNLDGDKLNITGGSKIKIESSDTDIL